MKLREEKAYTSPSYDKTQPIKVRIGDFLGKYHIILNGVVAHERFDLRYEGKPEEQCDTSHKKEIIEFVEALFNSNLKEEREGIIKTRCTIHHIDYEYEWDLSTMGGLKCPECIEATNTLEGKDI